MTTGLSNGLSDRSKGATDLELATSSAPVTRSSSRSLVSPIPVVGLFLFYIAHDALQERMFRFQGFEFGFFMTLVEALVMIVGSRISEGRGDGSNARGTTGKQKTLSLSVLLRIGWVGLFLALAHGLGNSALNYSPYPLKVAFKSCKLVPTMILGACITGRRYTALQFSAAVWMGIGLAVLTAADMFHSKQPVPLEGVDSDWSKKLGPFTGPLLLTISTVLDSIVPNMQEQLLRTAQVRTDDLILVSNCVMCVVLMGYTLYSGELVKGLVYCAAEPLAARILLAQSLAAYLGLRCYLAIIRERGGVVGVLLANARKVATIILSFLIFSKPFNERHVVGLALIFFGVCLGYLSKRGGKGAVGEGALSGRKVRRRRKKRRDKSLAHNV